jgi:hypothetical protein
MHQMQSLLQIMHEQALCIIDCVTFQYSIGWVRLKMHSHFPGRDSCHFLGIFCMEVKQHAYWKIAFQRQTIEFKPHF